MSFIGGIQNFLSGGANSQAEEALNRALAAYSNVSVPTEKQLTLPQLQQYVQQGLMTAAQAEAVIQKNNAMNGIKTDPKAKEAEITALNQLQDLAANGGHDAQSDAGVADAESKLNQTIQGQRGSVMDQMAARGIPTSLMGTAAQLAFAGQDAEQAHKDALQAKSDAASRALSALSQSGQLGGQIESQNFGEEAAKAQSQNAIDQWNAANQTNVNLANQQARQQANLFNQQEAQATANANTTTSNARTQYNAQLPQQVFADQMSKASGMAGVNEKQADQYTGVGKENMGVSSGIINSITDMFKPQIPGMGGGSSFGAPAASSAGASGATDAFSAAGPAVMAAAHGGKVPGQPMVTGDSPANDKVPALLSPGEVVVPRSHASSPNLAAEFVRHLHKAPTPKGVHPDDVKSVMHALTAMRGGF